MRHYFSTCVVLVAASTFGCANMAQADSTVLRHAQIEVCQEGIRLDFTLTQITEQGQPTSYTFAGTGTDTDTDTGQQAST